MSLAKSVTREGLLGAMREYDALGAEAFHAKHGTTEKGCRYWLRHGGKGGQLYMGKWNHEKALEALDQAPRRGAEDDPAPARSEED